MDHWINSNSGDYITLDNSGNYTLCLISRYIEPIYDEKYDILIMKGYYLKFEQIKITPAQFAAVKGFVPIKSKKLFGRQKKNYAPTLSGGVKGKSMRMGNIPTKSESRDSILKSLGL